MNVSLLLIPSFITYSTAPPKTAIPLLQLERTEHIVSLPSQGVPLPACPFCNLSRCHPLPFCYTLKHGLRGVSMGSYCGTEDELSSLVRDRLASHSTDDACQPAVADAQLAYCWCQNVTRSVTIEDDLRRVRIWRYQSLKWHADKQNFASTSLPHPVFSAISLIYTLFL